MQTNLANLDFLKILVGALAGDAVEFEVLKRHPDVLRPDSLDGVEAGQVGLALHRTLVGEHYRAVLRSESPTTI